MPAGEDPAACDARGLLDPRFDDLLGFLDRRRNCAGGNRVRCAGAREGA